MFKHTLSKRSEWEGFSTYSCVLLPLCLVWCRGIEDFLDTQAAADSAGWQELQKDPATRATCHHFPSGNPDRWPVDNKDTCTHLTDSNKNWKEKVYIIWKNNKGFIFLNWWRLRADHVIFDLMSILLKIHHYFFYHNCFSWL